MGRCEQELDANLSGIRLLAASGDLTNVTVDGISHPNGSQGGRAIYVDNRLGSATQTVNITDATVTNYQKNGIDVRGDVNVTVSDSVVGAGGLPVGCAAGLQARGQRDRHRVRGQRHRPGQSHHRQRLGRAVERERDRSAGVLRR